MVSACLPSDMNSNIKKKTVFLEQDGTLRNRETLIIDDPQVFSLAMNPLRYKILKQLCKQDMYPAELAKELNESQQNIYYNVRKLLDAGLIKVTGGKEVRGGQAKLFRTRADAIMLELQMSRSGGERGQLIPAGVMRGTETRERVLNFFSGFIKTNFLSARIVVGSPDPHGPYKACARDGHFAVHLAHFLGQFSVNPFDFTVSLDVEVLARKPESPLIVVGGPITNLVAMNVNEYLPVKFTETQPFGLNSKKTGRTYVADTIGMICKIKDPENSRREIITLAGVKRSGTRAAVLALTNFNEKLLSGKLEAPFSRVVEGIDVSGNGQVDSISILE
ncbi:MAG: helix-turn-helix domain-containing protein [Candidatus Hodarchaeota archaeon]